MVGSSTSIYLALSFQVFSCASILFLSRRFQGSSFPSFSPCFHSGFFITHKRCSMKYVRGRESCSEKLSFDS
jgi:hypothetical protein